MVTDAVWAEAGDVAGRLCVGCLEERIGRVLTPEDFLPLPVNDDDELDSVRLRTRKGSGRAVEALYQLGATAVLELGVDSANVAEVLELDGRLLAIRVDQARFSRRALAEIEADEMPEAALARRLAVGMADGLMREGP
jgi:carbamoylphosphate synthase large subunit